MAFGRVQARGQVTLPREIREKVGIKPGDVVSFEVIGKNQIRCTVLPNLSPWELRERFPIDVPIDESVNRSEWEAEAVKQVLGSDDG